MEQKIIVLRERTRRTRHRSRKDVRARRRICGVLAALCFLLLLGVVGGMENGTMALGIGTVRVMGTGTAGVLLTGGPAEKHQQAVRAGIPGGAEAAADLVRGHICRAEARPHIRALLPACRDTDSAHRHSA